MQPSTVLLCICLSAATAAAQKPRSLEGKWTTDNNIEYTSRGNVSGQMTGRLSTIQEASEIAGIKQITRYRFNSQDQNSGTPESFKAEIWEQDPTTGFPGWPNSMNTPLFAMTLNHGGATVNAWTITPASPVVRTNPDLSIYFAWEVPPNAAWTADGLSMHMGTGTSHACGTAGNPGCCTSVSNPMLGGWELIRPGLKREGAPTDSPAGNLAQASIDRNWCTMFESGDPTLMNLVKNDIDFCLVNSPVAGHAAQWPDVNDSATTSRYDDIGWEIRGGTAFGNGLAVVINTQSAGTPINVPGLGSFQLDAFDRFFPLLIQGAITLNGQGFGQLILPLGARMPNNPTRVAVGTFGDMHSQALVFNSTLTTIRLTNLDVFHFPTDGSFTAFNVHAMNTLILPAAGNRRIVLANHGKGRMVVKSCLNNMSPCTQTPGSQVVTVMEGTTRIVPIAPGSTHVHVESTVDLNAAGPGQMAPAGEYKLQ